MMESGILSRSIMVTNDTKISNKELPTTKWRRDRRLRTSEYHSSQQQQSSTTPSPPPQTTTTITVKPILTKKLSSSTTTTTITTTSTTSTISVKSPSELNGMINGDDDCETPLDMTLSSSKPRSPPPPYGGHHILPGSTFITNTRPSVITQAPKRDLIGSLVDDSISMCDPVIDEHFRRSLGDDYMILFNKNNIKTESQKIQGATTPSPPPPPLPSTTAGTASTIVTDAIELSVDDHFAKALGDTWKKLQEENKPQNNNNIKSNNNNNNNKKDSISCVN